MRKSKHLLLYEAFNASTLSKTLNFLDKEVNKDAKNRFIAELKNIKNIYDLSIDKISDEYFEYFGKIDALEIGENNRENVNNQYGIYALKFWFSIDKETGGYLGYSAVGSTDTIGELDVSSQSSSSSRIPPEERLEALGLTSKMVQVTHPSKLSTGDKIVGLFDGDYTKWRKFGIAHVFIEKGSIPKYYAIQNIAEGSTPYVDNSSEWRKYGPLSWRIGSQSGFGTDVNYICKIVDIENIKTSDPKLDTEKKIDPMMYNLPVYKGKMARWHQSRISILKEVLDKADFGIILYFDKMINSEVIKPSAIRSSRIEFKKDAYALKSNNDVKSENIQRYINHIIKSMGIDIDEGNINLKNLQKYPKRILYGKFAFMQIRTGNLHDKIQSYIDQLFEVMDYSKKSESSYGTIDKSNGYLKDSIDYLMGSISSAYRNNADIVNLEKNYQLSIDFLNNTKGTKSINKETSLEILSKIINIGKIISDKFESYKIETITDLQIFEEKVRSIRAISTRRGFTSESIINNLYSPFYDGSFGDLEYYWNRILDSRPEYIKDQLDVLKNIEKYVSSIL